VTVSYFEWLKNLSHVRFGRMERRWEEARGTSMTSALEELTGKKLHPSVAQTIIHGADEHDLVRSGLEDTMCGAFTQIRDRMHANPAIESLRTGAFCVAVDKVATSYLELGVFP
jgi:glutamate dehydrogenase (NAD(P)+)